MLLPGLAKADPDFFKKPETASDYWQIISFEVQSGKYEIASDYVRQLMGKKPTDDELFALATDPKVGLNAFLQLRLVPKWSDRKDIDTETRKAVEELIGRVAGALKAKLEDPVRIRLFVEKLLGEPEEVAFATRELQRAGAAAVPILIDFVRTNPTLERRSAVFGVLPRLPFTAVPPLAAALEIPDDRLRIDILDSLRNRADFQNVKAYAETDILADVWFFSDARSNLSGSLRDKARAYLALLTGRAVTGNRGEIELTEIAKKFLVHKGAFLGGADVVVWKLVDNKLVPLPQSKSAAEEYYGLRAARLAVKLSPDYLPAQVIFLTQATEKQMLRVGPVKPLAESSPDLFELLSTSPVPLLTETLSAALESKNTLVASAILQTFKARPEAGLAVSSTGRPAILVKALSDSSPRVRFAAAAAILAIPGEPTHGAQAQVIEVLRDALSGSYSTPEAPAKPKAMIGDPDPVRAGYLAGLLSKVGYDVTDLRTSRDVLKTLATKTGYEIVFVDSHIYDPPLVDLLAQVHRVPKMAGIPMFLVASISDPETTPRTRLEIRNALVSEDANLRAVGQDALARVVTRNAAMAEIEIDKLKRHKLHNENLEVIPEPMTEVALREVLNASLANPDVTPLSDIETTGYAKRAAEYFQKIARNEIPGYDIRPAEKALRAALSNDALAPLILDAVSGLPGAGGQQDLANVMLDNRRPVPIRQKAAELLARSLKQKGVLLSDAQKKAVLELAGVEPDAGVKVTMVPLVGILSGTATGTANRIQNFGAGGATVPVVPKPEVAPKPKEAPKDETKE